MQPSVETDMMTVRHQVVQLQHQQQCRSCCWCRFLSYTRLYMSNSTIAWWLGLVCVCASQQVLVVSRLSTVQHGCAAPHVPWVKFVHTCYGVVLTLCPWLLLNCCWLLLQSDGFIPLGDALAAAEQLDAAAQLEQQQKQNAKSRGTFTPPWVAGMPRFVSPSLRLHQEVVAFTQILEPTPQEADARRTAVEAVRGLVQGIWKDADVKPFGSYATGEAMYKQCQLERTPAGYASQLEQLHLVPGLRKEGFLYGAVPNMNVG